MHKLVRIIHVATRMSFCLSGEKKREGGIGRAGGREGGRQSISEKRQTVLPCRQAVEPEGKRTESQREY